MKRWFWVTLVFLAISFVSALAGPGSFESSGQNVSLAGSSAGIGSEHAEETGWGGTEDLDGNEQGTLSDPPVQITEIRVGTQVGDIRREGTSPKGVVWFNGDSGIPLMTVKGTAPNEYTVMVSDGGGGVWDSGVGVNGGSWIVENIQDPFGTGRLAEGSCYAVKATTSKGDTEGPEDIVSLRIDNTPPIIEWIQSSLPGSVSNRDPVYFQFAASDVVDSGCGCGGGNSCSNLFVTSCSLDDANFAVCASDAGVPLDGGSGKHVLRVRAVDKAGNFKQIVHAWTSDFMPPTVSIGKAVKNPTNETTARFEFSAQDLHSAVSATECSFDKGGFTMCSSPHDVLNVDAGDRQFEVRAIDQAGNTSAPVRYVWKVDRTSPNIKIESKPRENYKFPKADFTFSSTTVEDINETQCALDPVGEEPSTTEYQRCAGSGHSVTVGEGEHRFFVRALDLAGNISAVDRWTWKADFKSPVAVIGSNPRPPKLDNKLEVVFTFSSEASDVAEYQCAVIPGKVLGKCESGQLHTIVGEGMHVFTVHAVDKAGNEGPADTYEWEVDTQSPEVNISLPLEWESTQTPVIRGRTEPGIKVRIKIDNEQFRGDISAEQSGEWLVVLEENEKLGEGAHKVEVTAIDKAGNFSKSGTATIKDFVVDTIRPKTTFVRFPGKVLQSRVADFKFAASEEKVTFQCSLDDANPERFSDCPEEYKTAALRNGKHTLYVRAVDRAKNVEHPPVEWPWEVSVDVPRYPNIDQPADGTEVNTGTPVIAGTAGANGVVTVLIDGDEHGTASVKEDGTWTFLPSARLDEGFHELSGRFKDKDGFESEDDTPVLRFKVLLPKETGVLSGGAGCSASGLDFAVGAASFWSLLALLGLSRRRRA